ncbi:MAG: anti-sigma factor [Pseudomonadota bacterium]
MVQDTTPEDETLASEYVLGVLDGDQRADAAARIGRDVAFARLVADWEERLGGFNDGYKPVEPPASVKSALDDRLFGAEQKSGGILNWFFGALTAAVIALAVLISVGPPPGRLVAELAADDSPFAFSVAVKGDALQLARSTGDVPSDRDLELWLIVGETAPVSLGVFTTELAIEIPDLGEGYVLAVSLEPKGGSTTGAPTGPVVAAGALEKI